MKPMKDWLMRIVAVAGLALLLPLTAHAVTTQPVTSIPVVEQATHAYDSDSVRVVPDSLLAGTETAQPTVPTLGLIAKAVAAKSTVQEGTTVFRVWGDEAGAWGRSWTTVDPRTVPGYRGAAGLPNQNTGRFISEGVLQDTKGITLKPADPLHGNAGGLPEVVIPNPQNQIRLQNVQGLNPEF